MRNLSLAVAILDENLKGPSAAFDEAGLSVVRSAWLEVKEALSTPTGRVTREDVARIIDPWAFDVRIGEMGTGRPDQRPHYREIALAKADAILAMISAAPTREDDSWVLVPREPTEEMLLARPGAGFHGVSVPHARRIWRAMISAAPAPLEGEGDSSGAESAASPIASGAGTAGEAQRKSEDGANANFRTDVPDVEEVIRYLRTFGPGTTDSTDLYFMRWAADHLCNLVSLVGFWRAQAALTAYPLPSPDAEPSAGGA